MSNDDNYTPFSDDEIHIDFSANAEEGNLTKRIKGYKFAFELLNSANLMINLLNELDESEDNFWKNKTYVYSAIILSYSMLEAIYNEIIHIYAIERRSSLNNEDKKLIYIIGKEGLKSKDNTHVLSQFNLFLRIIGKPELKEDEEPYQSANLVRKLRNMIVHPVPGMVVTYTDQNDFNYSEQQKIVKQLKSKLNLDNNAIFPDSILTKDCASWVFQSCVKFLSEFVKVSGIDIGFSI